MNCLRPTALPTEKHEKKGEVSYEAAGFSGFLGFRKVVMTVNGCLMEVDEKMLKALIAEVKATEALCDAYDAEEADRDAPRWCYGG